MYNATEILPPIDPDRDVIQVEAKPTTKYKNAVKRIQNMAWNKQGKKKCWEKGCNASYETNGRFVDHYRHKHLNDSTFRCGICDQGFALKADGKRHIESVHLCKLNNYN